MKRFKIIVLILATLTLPLSACGADKTPKQTETPPPIESEMPIDTPSPDLYDGVEISEYFPFKENTIYKYIGTSGKISDKLDQTAFIGYINGDIAQRVLIQKAGRTTEILQNRKGELNLVYADPSYYFFENITSSRNTNVAILKEPLEIDKSWKFDQMSTCTVTGVDILVETPYKNFDKDTLEVTVNYQNGIYFKYYYVKNIGLVKNVSFIDGEESTYALSEIQENAKLQVAVDFYDYNIDNNYEISFKEGSIEIATNEDFAKLFEKELNYLLPKDAKLNYIDVDREKSLVIVDFSEQFISNISLSAESEGAALQCIANTLGNFYELENCLITINGDIYQSGNIALEENYPLKVLTRDGRELREVNEEKKRQKEAILESLENQNAELENAENVQEENVQ